MKIMIFAEGTTFDTKLPLCLFSKRGYRPIGNAVRIVNGWYDRGDEIFLCSYLPRKRMRLIRSVVDFYGMRVTELLCRDKGERYADLVERVMPDVLIEDDCRSIGGLKECCITGVREELKRSIRSVIVPEFGGIDGVKIEQTTERIGRDERA